MWIDYFERKGLLQTKINMKEKIAKFMQGRYGVDQLNRFLLGVSIVLLLISFFAGDLFYLLAFACLGYSYYRMFSKNFNKRYEENQKFTRYAYKWWVFKDKQKNALRQRKNYHIYKCPSCRQKIRIPRGKGKVAISCPKCHYEFIKRS